MNTERGTAWTLERQPDPAADDPGRRLPADVIARPALQQRLERAGDLPLTLIVAPAGYGKTTLLASWASQSPRPIAWLTPDPAGCSLRAFTLALLRAVQRVAPLEGAAVRRVFAADDPSPREVARALAIDLSVLEADVTLVIDDLHWVAGPETGAMLNALLRLPPSPIHLVAASRFAIPGLHAERLRLLGFAETLTEADLRLSLEEIAAVLHGQATIGPAEALDRTEGWAAGVRMLGAARTPAAGMAVVAEFFEQEALASEPEKVLSLLRDVSAAAWVTPDLAAAMTGGRVDAAAAAALLAEAAGRGLFVRRDAERERWTIHPLMGETLTRQLAASAGLGAVRDSRERAARWLCAAGRISEAVEQAAEAGLPALVAEIIETSVPDAVREALEAGQPGLVAKIIEASVAEWIFSDWSGGSAWVDHLTEERTGEQPALMVARLANLLARSNVPAMLAWSDRIERLLDERDPGRADPTITAMRWDVVRLRGFTAFQGGEPAVSLDRARGLADGPPGKSPLAQGTGVMIWGGEMSRLGRWAEARPVVEALAIASMESADLVAFLSSCTLAAFDLRSGAIGSADTWISLARRVSDVGGHAPIAASLNAIESGLLVESGDLAGAARVIRTGLDAAPGGIINWRLQVSVQLARIQTALGQFDQAAATLSDIRRRLGRCAAQYLLPFVLAADAELALASGNLRAAARWADMEPVRVPPDLGRMIEHPVETQARIWLVRRALGDAAQARAALDRLAAHERATADCFSLARTLPLLAAAEAAAGDGEAALGTMREALGLEPGVLPRRFTTAGAEAMDLLARIAADPADPVAPRAARMLAAADGEPLSLAPVPRRRRGAPAPGAALLAHPAHPALPGELLSPEFTSRQLDILRLLVQWRTDKEMAQELNLSPHTVHEHVGNIMRKLNVTSRREIRRAVAASRILDGMA